MMTPGISSHKDFIGGLLVMLLGFATIWEASSYSVGTLSRMGPGYFPLALGVILAATGVLILLTSRVRTPAEAELVERLPPEWRGWLCICAGIVAFVVIGRFAGLLPATFATVFISALGDRENTVPGAILLAAIMTFVCFVIFWWLLQVQLPLFHWG
jgi:hypothetical protein